MKNYTVDDWKIAERKKSAQQMGISLSSKNFPAVCL